MNRLNTLSRMGATTLCFALWACGGDAPADGSRPASTPSAAVGADLTPEELEQGIGPIRDLSLAAVDPALAATGEEAFALKCSACHKIDVRYVGPPLHDVLAKRRPEYVMNMILNANEMVARHPAAREMLAQYYTPMTVQVVDHDEARALLEYLRSVQSSDASASQ